MGPICQYSFMMDIDSVPLVKVPSVMDEWVACLDESAGNSDTGYSGTQKLEQPVTFPTRLRMPQQLTCTFGQVEDIYYFQRNGVARLSLALAESAPPRMDAREWEERKAAKIAPLIQGMCLHLRMVKRRTLAVLKRLIKDDPVRASQINTEADAFALTASHVWGIQQDPRVQVGQDRESTIVKTSDCVVKLFHAEKSDRFAAFISAALQRSFGGACLVPGGSIGSDPGEFVVQLSPQGTAGMAQLTCQPFSDPIALIGTYTFNIQSVPALREAPLVEGRYELVGDADMAARKLCASVAAMRDHVYTLRGL